MFYCAGFLRVELELNEQKKRINDLENNQENKPPDVPNRDKLTKNTHGKSFLLWLNILQSEHHTECLFDLFFKKILASAENLVYTVDILSLRVFGVEVKKTEGEQVTICFLCRE